MKITANEFAVMQAIDASEYGDGLCDAIWTFSMSDHCSLAKRAIPGTVSSLTKKGLVVTGGTTSRVEGDMFTIGLTEKGATVYLAQCKKRSITANKSV